MAGSGDDDLERLLREVEASLGGPPAKKAKAEVTPAKGSGGGLSAAVPTAFVSAAAAGVVTWLLFAVLPFVSAWSGAWGAALATFVSVLVLRWRRG
jgi:hypothetical protein